MLSKLSSMNTSSDELDDPFDIPWYIEEEIDEANDIADFYDRDEYYLEKFTEFDLNICNFSAKHLRDVKLLNSSVLPVIYDDRFYSEYITNDKADKDGIFLCLSFCIICYFFMKFYS